jgi:hypothetical protein
MKQQAVDFCLQTMSCCDLLFNGEEMAPILTA